MTHTYQYEQITRTDCEQLTNVPCRETRRRGLEDMILRLDMNPSAEKTWWHYDYYQPPQRISIINGTPLLDEEGNPYKTVEDPYPLEAVIVRKGTSSPLIILIRREERRARRAETRSVRRVVTKQRPTFNAVPEDIVWHMHRKGKTLDNWSLSVLKSRNRNTIKSLRKTGAA